MIDLKKFREELRQRLGSGYKAAREQMGLSSDYTEDTGLMDEVSDDGLEIVEVDTDSELDRLKQREVDIKKRELDAREKKLQNNSLYYEEEGDAGLGDLGNEQPQPDYEDGRQRTTSNQLEVALKGWRQDMLAASIMNMSPEDLARFIEGLKVDGMQVLVDNAKIGGEEGPSEVGGVKASSASPESGLELADL